jgi:formate C-acetyltransferase
LVHIYVEEQDIFSEAVELKRPAYLMSSMVDNCFERGRNIHGGGAVYHDYGITPLGLPNVADGMFAIKKAVFEDKICTAEQFVEALRANYKRFEQLQFKLKSIPKYGVDEVAPDNMMHRIANDISNIYLRCTNRYNGRVKPTILTFIYAPLAAAILGATPDGRGAGSMVAQGVTPQSCAMKQSISAAINSCGKLPFDKFNGGASTMWDFDSEWVNESIVKAVLKTALEKNIQIFQGNTTSVEELIKAKANPENYEHLMVRVGGYSARFTLLSPEIQDEIINRYRHNR